MGKGVLLPSVPGEDKKVAYMVSEVLTPQKGIPEIS